MTRNTVIATRAVAAQHWMRQFDEVLADAKAGTDGLTPGTQTADKSDCWPIDLDVAEGRHAVAILIKHARSGGCGLYQQGW